MTWFNNLKIYHKFLILSSVILFFFLSLSGVGVWGTSQVQGIVDVLNNEQIPEIGNINQISVKVEAVKSNLLYAAIANKPAEVEGRIKEIRENIKISLANMDVYYQRNHTSEEWQVAQLVKLQLVYWATGIEKSIKLIQANDPQALQKALGFFEEDNYKKLELNIQKLSNISTNKLPEFREKSTQTFNTVLVALGVFSGLIVVFSLGIVFVMANSINGRLTKLRKSMTALAEGDLTQQVDMNNKDELGELGQTYNTTLVSLRNLVEQLHNQSQQVSTATYELSVQARNQVTGSNQQASAIMEITQALQELSQTADNIALQATKSAAASENSLKQAQLVSQAADKMAQSQELGRANVAQTIETLFSLKEQVGAIEHHQQELQAQSNDIQRIVGIIDEIAHETHLLALNAAIEAAGAGQYGDRFAVIAGEVKRLANNSVEATKEVRRSIAGITRAVERSSQSASEGVRQAEKATNEASQSDSTLLTLTELSQEVKTAARAIVSHIDQTATLATGIGVATQQQQIASQQVLQTMLSIEAVTAQNLSSVRQGDAATQQLSSSARQLEHSANVFKLAAA